MYVRVSPLNPSFGLGFVIHNKSRERYHRWWVPNFQMATKINEPCNYFIDHAIQETPRNTFWGSFPMVFCNGCCRVKDNRKEVLQSSFLATTSTHWWIFRYLTYVYIWDVSLVFLRAARVIIRQLLNKMHTHLGISISLHSVLQGIGSSLK